MAKCKRSKRTKKTIRASKSLRVLFQLSADR